MCADLLERLPGDHAEAALAFHGHCVEIFSILCRLLFGKGPAHPFNSEFSANLELSHVCVELLAGAQPVSAEGRSCREVLHGHVSRLGAASFLQRRHIAFVIATIETCGCHGFPIRVNHAVTVVDSALSVILCFIDAWLERTLISFFFNLLSIWIVN